MAAEHWCKEHQMAWFKKGKMKGYAHPILDEDGEPTGGWCNEPKSEATEKPAETSRSGNTNTSIEQQVAIKEVGECWRAGMFQIDEPLVTAYLAWILDKLDGYYKGGKDVSTKVSTEKTGRDTGEGLGQGDREGGEFDEKWWQEKLAILNNNSWVKEQLQLAGVTMKQGQRLREAIKNMEPSKRALLKNGVELALAYKEKTE